MHACTHACMYSMHYMHTYIYWLHVIVSIYMYNHLHSKWMYTLIRTSCTNLALRYLLIWPSLEILGLVPTWFILSQQLIPSWLPSQHCCRRWMYHHKYHNASVYFSSEKCIKYHKMTCHQYPQERDGRRVSGQMLYAHFPRFPKLDAPWSIVRRMPMVWLPSLFWRYSPPCQSNVFEYCQCALLLHWLNK